MTVSPDLRTGLAAGLLYGVPFSVWLLGQVESGPVPPDLSAAVPVLAGCQALMLLLLLPMGDCQSGRGRVPRSPPGCLLAAALLVMVPWPTLILALGTGTVSWSALASAQGAVALWGLLLEGAGGLVRRLARTAYPVAVATLRGLALVLLLLLFAGYPDRLVVSLLPT